MAGGRPSLNVRAFHLNFPNAQARAAIRLKHAVRLFGTAFHVNERFELRLVGGQSRQYADHSLSRQWAVPEPHFRFIARFHEHRPLEPLRFFTGQFNPRQRGHFRDITGAGDTTATIYCRELHHQGIAVAKIAERLAIIMHAIHRGGPHTDGVDSAVGYAALPMQRREANVSASIMATHEIRVRRIGNIPEAVDLKELRQLRTFLALKIKRRLLRIFPGDRPGAKLCRPTNGFLCRDKIVVHQPTGSDQLSAVVIEPVHLHLLRKILGGIPHVHIQPEQFANGLSIFPRVEPTQHTTPTGGIT